MSGIYSARNEPKLSLCALLDFETFSIPSGKFSNCHEQQQRDDYYDDSEESSQTKQVIKVSHHDHQSGKFLHSLCKRCNLKESDLFDPSDVHLISKGGEKLGQIEITAKNEYVPELKYSYNSSHIPSGKQSYGVLKLNVRFIDSFQFLTSSISNLAKGLKKENAPALSLVKEGISYIFPCKQHDYSLLLEKLQYPYKNLTSRKVLDNGHPIPGREHFNTELKKENVTDWECEWEEREKLKIIDWKTFAGQDETGYILNVSLAYPECIHDETSDLPLAPEQRRVKLNELSEGQQ
ncbi:unnamed protein product [Allacma fusca]|uniref:Uncharacterized protein n=1 Tax=Allacma fusca TaxID=39272 RepID=A0A8J2KVQ5_9HEXA|nr:unnamed protein product [Allacma fusca]